MGLLVLDPADVGVFCVAYGRSARRCAQQLVRTVHEHARLPVCVVSDWPFPQADLFVSRRQRDPGGRWAKVRIWDLAPQEWRSVLYLDADILVRESLDPIFKILDGGWDLVMTQSPPQCATMRSAQRKKYEKENIYSDGVLGGNRWLQMSGGVWAFRRNEKTKAYLKRLVKEWGRFKQRDQQAMNRAWYRSKLKTWLLPREWNWFMHHEPPSERAAILHFATAARDWVVKHPGRGLWEDWQHRV